MLSISSLSIAIVSCLHFLLSLSLKVRGRLNALSVVAGAVFSLFSSEWRPSVSWRGNLLQAGWGPRGLACRWGGRGCGVWVRRVKSSDSVLNCDIWSNYRDAESSGGARPPPWLCRRFPSWSQSGVPREGPDPETGGDPPQLICGGVNWPEKQEGVASEKLTRNRIKIAGTKETSKGFQSMPLLIASDWVWMAVKPNH